MAFRYSEAYLEIPDLGLIIQNTTCFVLMVISGTLLSKNVNKFNMGSVSSYHQHIICAIRNSPYHMGHMI